MVAVRIAGYGVSLITGFEALLEKVSLSSQAAVNIVVWHLACALLAIMALSISRFYSCGVLAGAGIVACCT
jgi:hypothetical protein